MRNFKTFNIPAIVDDGCEYFKLAANQWSYIGWQNLNLLSQPNGNTSATSKASNGQWWKFELCDTSATSKASKAKWWNFKLLAESLVWHPIYDHCLKHWLVCNADLYANLETESVNKLPPNEDWMRLRFFNFHTQTKDFIFPEIAFICDRWRCN